MLSRVAESVFWMARYMERTNGLLRLLRSNYIASQDEMTDFTWRSVLQTYGYLSVEEIENIQTNSRAVLAYVMLDKDNDASLINNITRSRENAKVTQDHISKEMWHALNAFHLLIREPNIEQLIKHEDPITALDALIKQGMFMHGTVDITMARGEAYNFLNIGRFIERAIIITDVLDINLRNVKYDIQHSIDDPSWRYVLYSLSGYEFYIKTYRGVMNANLVIQQVLYNQNFVHSVLYCLHQIVRYFKRLFTESIPENYEYMDFLTGKALNNLKYNTRETNDGAVIKNILLQTRSDLFEIAKAFNKYYFGYN